MDVNGQLHVQRDPKMIINCHHIQTGFGAHPASCPVGNEVFFPGIMRPGRDADRSHPSSAEVKDMWSYITISQYVFVA
jgi:hypothetical protein